MKYIFFGTPEFASIVLEKMISAGLPPEAVVCNPDRPVGRKKVVTPPPVKVLAQKYGIEVLQPENPVEIFDELSDIDADAFVVAAYSKILPKEIIGIPRLGTIGVHPSLLPKYRGASPIQSVILNGEKETGVTLYLLDEKMDHGKIVSSVRHQVPGIESYKELEKLLAELGGELLVKTLPRLVAGEINPEPQNESEATYTKKFSTEDAFVDEKLLESALDGNAEAVGEIYRKILALTPEPGVWTMKNGKRMKLLAAEINGGRLVLKTTQMEGQKPVKVN